jgi:phosphate transport system protein
MTRLHLTQHISAQFNSELEQLSRRLLAMGGLVEEQLTAALRILAEGDARYAAEVVAREDQVNAAEVEIDEQCTFILARRQPAASDLRLVLSVIKMLGDIERIGDEGHRIARMAERAIADIGDDAVLLKIEEMGQAVREMLRGALDAFARTDEALAIEVIRRDRKVDARYDDLTRALVVLMSANPDRIAGILPLLWVARSLERIGDRCKNLSEHVVYIVRGKDVRHTRFGRGDEPEAS